ncbi:MAG: helix-turn-helix transcriptional regulator [Alcanivorax jadensis]|uniref:helix-turn-helix transcriptional regulator n=1 Tax=Alcanivorax jadensis TaxID=64988 RepID=UPI0030037EFD
MARDIKLDTTILKEARGALSQEAVAERAGISREAYVRLESRGTCLKTTATKIADILGVTVKHLQGMERAELFSPYFCEVHHTGINEGRPTRHLFNKDSEVVPFIESYISCEHPFPIEDITGGGLPEYPARSIPKWYASPDNKECSLEIPIRDSDQQFLKFILRELHYRHDTGYVWRPMTQWPKLTLGPDIRKTLSAFYPEFFFNGHHIGEKTKFMVSLRVYEEAGPANTVFLEDQTLVLWFIYSLCRSMPECTVNAFSIKGGISLDLMVKQPFYKVHISLVRVHVDDLSAAPFPKAWGQRIAIALELNKEPRLRKIGSPENKGLPRLSELMYSMEDVKEEYEHRRQNMKNTGFL